MVEHFDAQRLDAKQELNKDVGAAKVGDPKAKGVLTIKRRGGMTAVGSGIPKS